MSRTILMICKKCGKDFDLLKKEHTRQVKKGRDPKQFYCSLSCSPHINNPNPKPPPPSYGNQFNRKGEFTYYLNKSRNRKDRAGGAHKWPHDIDEAYLQSVWTGKCAITGVPIYTKSRKIKAPDTASLDRIDSSLGYIKGNVQFVAYAVNLAKNDFTQDVITQFFKSIRTSLSSPNFSSNVNERGVEVK
jgi:hypothetical protein